MGNGRLFSRYGWEPIFLLERMNFLREIQIDLSRGEAVYKPSNCVGPAGTHNVARLIIRLPETMLGPETDHYIVRFQTAGGKIRPSQRLYAQGGAINLALWGSLTEAGRLTAQVESYDENGGMILTLDKSLLIRLWVQPGIDAESDESCGGLMADILSELQNNKGEKGDKGEKGEKGDRGDPGEGTAPETGTWTPVLVYNQYLTGFTFDIHSTVYIKQGRHVSVQAFLKITDVGTTGYGPPTVMFKGLPFMPSAVFTNSTFNSMQTMLVGSFDNTAVIGGAPAGMYRLNVDRYGQFGYWTSSFNSTTGYEMTPMGVMSSSMYSGNYILFSFSYLID